MKLGPRVIPTPEEIPARRPVLAFQCVGTPVPERRARWSPRTMRMHRDRSADEWKGALRAAAVHATLDTPTWAGPILPPVPLSLDIVLRFPRHPLHLLPDGTVHFGAPEWHADAPDKDNCEKAILDGLGAFDGLQPLLWGDDRQVAVGNVTKRFTRTGEQPGAALFLYRLDEPMEPLAQLTLTNGEAWWLDRRRAKLSIDDMAGLLGISPGIYRQWEREARDSPRRELSSITAGEWCAVLRVRHNLTLRELAALSGIPGGTIGAIEDDREPFEPLVAWWQRYLRALHRSYVAPPVPGGPEHGVVRAAPRLDLKKRPRRAPTPKPE